jgi:hypothetical protein
LHELAIAFELSVVVNRNVMVGGTVTANFPAVARNLRRSATASSSSCMQVPSNPADGR